MTAARMPLPLRPRAYDLALAVLSATPRHDSQGRRVGAATRDRHAAAALVRAFGQAGYLRPDAQSPSAVTDSVSAAVAQVVVVAAGLFGVAVDDVTGVCREQRVARARQAAMFVCRDRLCLTLTEVGRLFNRDHTTVAHGVRVIGEAMASDPRVRARVEACWAAAPTVATHAAAGVA